jgi:beta-glucanase (GH16 family)
MKNLINCLLVVFVMAGSYSPSSTFLPPLPSPCTWQQTFSDNFDGDSLDTSKWNTSYPSGNGGEQQFYAPDAFSLKDGILNITAHHHGMNGYPYTSGILTTQGTFSQKYGFFTMRAKLPKGQGFWPAFWMLPVTPDYPTEIDIFEMLGNDPHTLYLSNHWQADGEGEMDNKDTYQGPDFSSDYHTFSLRWRSDKLTWYIDGVEQHHTYQGVPQAPMFILIDFAVGGTWPGNPDDTTNFPSSMKIDYVKAYRQDCGESTSN